MTNVLKDRKRRAEVIPIDLPMNIWGFSRLENILYAVSKLTENRENITKPVIGYDLVRYAGIMGVNYRIMSKTDAERLKKECPRDFSYYSLDDLLIRKGEIEKAKRGERSKYVVRNNLIIGLNPSY
ncbi:MAG: hypothetical protein AABY07_05160, partial [Nanoarchaeota archaeon]